MKNFIKYSAFFLVILMMISCFNNTEEPVVESSVDVFALVPNGNDHFTILASKSVDIDETWETYDSLLFIKINANAEQQSKLAIHTLQQASIDKSYLLENGNILFSGNLNNVYSWNKTVYEYSLEGTMIWNLDLGEEANGIALANNDSLFIFGRKSTPWVSGENNYDKVSFTKISTNGDTSFSQIFESDSYNTQLNTGILTNDNGCIAAGSKQIEERGTEMWAVRFDAKGDTLWNRTYGGDRYDYIHSIHILKDNSILLLGEISVQDSTNSDYYLNHGEQTYLVKLNTQGDKLWTKSVGRTLRENIISFIEGQDGSLIISGYTEDSYAYIYDVPMGWISKLDAHGNKIWRTEFELSIPKDIIELDDGSILSVAKNIDIDSYYRNKNSLNILKLSSEGTLLSNTALIP